MTMRSIQTVIMAIVALGLSGCAGTGDLVETEDDLGWLDDGKFDSSIEAIIVDLEFDGELTTSSSWGVEQRIEDQLLYTIGHLNGDRSVGRLDRVELSEVRTERIDDGYHVTYHARMPVAWGHRDNVPETYELTLPRVATYSGFEAFTQQYMSTCVDWGAHDVDSGSMWYYYRPNAYRCELDADDVIVTVATVEESAVNTTGLYPEYHMVWEDDALRVVAIFGKYEDGATTSSDAGVAAYNSFVRSIQQELAPHTVVTTPSEVPNNPGVEVPDITFTATLPDGRQVEVVALLVDNVRTAGYDFTRRYESLTPTADLIAYNGHSGLGANIRALANKGRWVTGQYSIVFLNGCDTYAYIDSALANAHTRVNSDDPHGTKYLDIVTNAMPAYFRSDAPATMALVRGLMSYDAPRTYENIFESVDSSQVVLVTGEQDNTFRPGGGGNWEGLEADGTVTSNEEHRFETTQVDPGTYVFDMSGSADADLYVRVDAAPTTSNWDCRPYQSGSNESCIVTLDRGGIIHVMVRGYATSSDYELAGYQDGVTPPPPEWEGMDESGTVESSVEMRFETPTLGAGRYLFQMTGTNDSDLYVRVGAAPTTGSYDCRPYSSSSNETCTVDLTQESVIYIMVRGYASSSDFHLVGSAE